MGVRKSCGAEGGRVCTVDGDAGRSGRRGKGELGHHDHDEVGDCARRGDAGARRRDAGPAEDFVEERAPLGILEGGEAVELDRVLGVHRHHVERDLRRRRRRGVMMHGVASMARQEAGVRCTPPSAGGHGTVAVMRRWLRFTKTKAQTPARPACGGAPAHGDLVWCGRATSSTGCTCARASMIPCSSG